MQTPANRWTNYIAALGLEQKDPSKGLVWALPMIVLVWHLSPNSTHPPKHQYDVTTKDSLILAAM